MPAGSVLTEAIFVATVAAVAGAFAAAVWKTIGVGASAPRTAWALILGVFLFWLLVPAVLATRGDLSLDAPLPTPGAALFVLLTLATIVLAFSRFGARLAAGIPMAALVGYQAFRVPLELALHALYTEGVIPVQMTYSGRNFDIVTGVLAVVLALLLRAGRCPRWLVLAWNILGLALLANILVVAILSAPTPFRYFTNEPANLLASTFPYVWLPTFLVQAALFGHLLVFRALRVSAPSAAAPRS
jgi:hypothetical protein